MRMPPRDFYSINTAEETALATNRGPKHQPERWFRDEQPLRKAESREGGSSNAGKGAGFRHHREERSRCLGGKKRPTGSDNSANDEAPRPETKPLMLHGDRNDDNERGRKRN